MGELMDLYSNWIFGAIAFIGFLLAWNFGGWIYKRFLRKFLFPELFDDSKGEK